MYHNAALCRGHTTAPINDDIKSLKRNCSKQESSGSKNRISQQIIQLKGCAVEPFNRNRSTLLLTRVTTVKQQQSACDSCLFTSSERHIQVTAGGEDVSDVSRCVIKKNLLSLVLFIITERNRTVKSANKSN